MGASERDALPAELLRDIDALVDKLWDDPPSVDELEALVRRAFSLGREQGRQEERKAQERICIDCGRRITDGAYDLCMDCDERFTEGERGREGAGR